MSSEQGLDVKPFKADIVAFLFKLLFGHNIAVELWVSAEMCSSFPGVRDRTTQTLQNE